MHVVDGMELPAVVLMTDVAPLVKLVPVISSYPGHPRLIVALDLAVTVGAGFVTLNPFDSIPLLPSGLVTTTFHNP